MKKPISIIGSVLALALIVYFTTRDSPDTSTTKPQFAKTKRGDMIITLKESGFLNAVDELTIKNEISFNQLNITEVIPNGSYVKEGDFLISLDPEPLEKEKNRIETTIAERTLAVSEARNTLEITQSEVESEVTDAKNGIEFANLDLKKFKSLDKTRQLNEALTEIDIASDNLKFSEQSYLSSVELADKGFETKSKVDQDKLDLTAKEKKLKSVQAHYEILKDFDLHKEHLQLTRELEEAQNKYDRMKKQGENKVQKAYAKLENSEILLSRAEEELGKINQQLALAELRAPIEGYALYPKKRYYQDDKIEKGKTVNRNQTLLRIPDMSHMKVDIDVPEYYISDLSVGQKATITIDSLKDQTFPGVVGNVALLPIQTNSWQKSNVQKYKVEVNIENGILPKTIKPQISAAAEITLDILEDVLSIPIQAVHTVQGAQVVYVRSGINDEYKERKVEIGKIDTNYIQILNGLKEGEEVLISEPAL